MELSANLFMQITGEPEPASAAPPERLGIERRGSPRNRRRAARLATSLTAIVLRGDRTAPVGEDPGHAQVEVFDISPRSVGLVSPHRLNPGQQFILRLPTQQGRQLSVGCVSIRQQLTADGHYRIGAEFTHLLVSPPATVIAQAS